MPNPFHSMPFGQPVPAGLPSQASQFPQPLQLPANLSGNQMVTNALMQRGIDPSGASFGRPTANPDFHQAQADWQAARPVPIAANGVDISNQQQMFDWRSMRPRRSDFNV